MAEVKTPILISQKENFASAFGFVYRSSAIFYYTVSQGERTTISLMNYWKPKRNLDVYLIASLRDMAGNLIRREELSFAEGQVINYRPAVPTLPFQGSVEIEVLCSSNLMIPYAAVMVVYECDDSVSMVHSYGRVYSPHEVEEGRTITQGEESCWTVRDSDQIRGFAVFHNGTIRQDQQDVLMETTNSQNEKRQTKFNLPSINPYESVKVYPSEIYPEISGFLGGQPGNVSLSFQLGNSFTRMLVGNETTDGRERQVTHSNFNYSKHLSDTVEKAGLAYMIVPQVTSGSLRAVVYPDCVPGSYSVKYQEHEVAFSDGIRLEFPIPSSLIEFREIHGNMPTRIVTALTGMLPKADCILPFECSLGVLHADVPPKSSHWGLVAASSNLQSRLYILDNPFMVENKSFSGCSMYLYSSKDHSALCKELSSEDLEDLTSGVFVSDIFSDAETFLGGEFGYFYLKSPYGGLRVYTTLESTDGCMTLEHSF